MERGNQQPSRYLRTGEPPVKVIGLHGDEQDVKDRLLTIVFCDMVKSRIKAGADVSFIDSATVEALRAEIEREAEVEVTQVGDAPEPPDKES